MEAKVEPGMDLGRPWVEPGGRARGGVRGGVRVEPEGVESMWSQGWNRGAQGPAAHPDILGCGPKFSLNVEPPQGWSASRPDPMSVHHF